jgi:hypothetical protein
MFHFSAFYKHTYDEIAGQELNLTLLNTTNDVITELIMSMQITLRGTSLTEIVLVLGNELVVK